MQGVPGGDDVTCFGGAQGRDRYGRELATCHVWPRVNLNATMVSDGYALAYREYSNRYTIYEDGARNTKAGMWAGTFATPWDWRHAKSVPTLDELRERIERGDEQDRRNTL